MVFVCVARARIEGKAGVRTGPKIGRYDRLGGAPVKEAPRKVYASETPIARKIREDDNRDGRAKRVLEVATNKRRRTDRLAIHVSGSVAFEQASPCVNLRRS